MTLRKHSLLDLEFSQVSEESLKYINVISALNDMYPSEYDELYDFLKNSPVYQKQLSPADLKHRYIEEDIPYYFVPIVLLGKKMGVPMPICESFVYIANALNRVDYWKLGRDIRSFFRKKEAEIPLPELI